ncbi:Inner membrane protein YhaI [compost metagenome]
MTFQESVRVCLSKFADFSGRASRSEYWWFALFVFLGSLGTSMVSEMLGGIFGLAMLLPSIAVTTRRLHDTHRSGWWQLIYFVPIIGFIVMLVFLVQESKGDEALAQV